MTRHTTWTLGTLVQNDGSVAVLDTAGNRIAKVWGNTNASLIAKAPELLTAAQHAFSLLCKLRDEYGSVAHTPVHEELGRAIAEATGDGLALKAIAKMDHRLPPGTPDPR